MTVRSRIVIGTAVTFAALFDIFSFNKLQVFQDEKNVSKVLITATKLPFFEPDKGDLVLIMNQKQKQEFRSVEVIGPGYSHLLSTGVSMYVPGGFLLLRDLKSGYCSLEPYGVIIGQVSFEISKYLPFLNDIL